MCRSAAHSGPRGPIQAHLEDSLPCDRGHGGRSLEGSSSPWSGPSLSCSQAASWADLAPDEAREGVSRHLQTPGPFQSGPVKASPGSTISSFWFPSSAHMRQQVSRTQIIFSSPRERARFVSFCAIRRRPRRVWAGHGWVRGSLASGARWPAPSREALGSGGPRPSRLLPRTCLGDPGGPAVLHAGGPARRGRAAAGPSGPAAVATGAHSIRTCRRTLSITEATT